MRNEKREAGGYREIGGDGQVEGKRDRERETEEELSKQQQRWSASAAVCIFITISTILSQFCPLVMTPEYRMPAAAHHFPFVSLM